LEAELGLIVLLLGISAFFSGSEVAFLAVSDTRLHYLSARLLVWLRGHRSWVLSTVLIAITASNYSAERLATRGATQSIGSVWGPLVAYIVITIIVVIFCEITPVQYAARHREAVGLRASIPIVVLATVLAPVVFILTGLTRAVLLLAGVRPDTISPPVTEDQLKTMIEQGQRQGTVPSPQQRMLYGALDFGDQTVAQVMTPRPDIVWVGRDEALQQALEIATSIGFSRLPVCQGDPDDVVGIIYIKDILPYLRTGEMDKSVRQVARAPFFVPESLPANILLQQLQSRRGSIAVVKDEFGGTAGVVTVEDLLEEIVGEITDEYDVEEPEIEQLPDDELICDAGISLHLLANYVRQDLPETDYDSLAGLILDLAGHIPSTGEQVSWGNLTFYIEQATDNRIEKVRIVQAISKADE